MAVMVRGKVQTGAYASSSEVIREALPFLQGQGRTRGAKLDELRRQVAVLSLL